VESNAPEGRGTPCSACSRDARALLALLRHGADFGTIRCRLHLVPGRVSMPLYTLLRPLQRILLPSFRLEAPIAPLAPHLGTRLRGEYQRRDSPEADPEDQSGAETDDDAEIACSLDLVR